MEIEIECLRLFREDDKSLMIINQVDENKYKIMISQYGKLSLVFYKNDIEEIKQLVIDSVVNFYQIKSNNLFKNIFKDVFLTENKNLTNKDNDKQTPDN